MHRTQYELRVRNARDQSPRVATYVAQACFGIDFQLKRRSAVNRRLVVMRRGFSASHCC